MSSPITLMKKCTKCFCDKDRSMFRVKNDKPYSWCKQCENKYQKNHYHSKSAEERSAIHKKWRKKNPQYKDRAKARYSSEKRREFYNRSREDVLRASSEYYKNNKEHILSRISKYRKENKDKCSYWLSIHRAKKSMATPKWLNDEHLSQIKELYLESKRMSLIKGEPYEVDHIVPLKNDMVCGLHVPWNLRIVSRTENRKKNNKLVGGLLYE